MAGIEFPQWMDTGVLYLVSCTTYRYSPEKTSAPDNKRSTRSNSLSYSRLRKIASGVGEYISCVSAASYRGGIGGGGGRGVYPLFLLLVNIACLINFISLTWQDDGRRLYNKLLLLGRLLCWHRRTVSQAAASHWTVSLANMDIILLLCVLFCGPAYGKLHVLI